MGKRSDYQAKWRAANPDKVKATQRKWYEDHREEILARNKVNHARRAQALREWRERIKVEDPERYAEWMEKQRQANHRNYLKSHPNGKERPREPAKPKRKGRAPRICKICGKQFLPHSNRQLCCSRDCTRRNSKHGLKPVVIKTCPTCGKLFEGTSMRVFCCESCRLQYWSHKTSVRSVKPAERPSSRAERRSDESRAWEVAYCDDIERKRELFNQLTPRQQKLAQEFYLRRWRGSHM